MSKKSKRFREIEKSYDPTKTYSFKEAIDILKRCKPVKFDQTVEVALMTGVDPKKSELQVRGTVSLPNGTGKKMVILVLASGDKIKEALAAGADFAGNEDLIEKIKGGWTGFDAVVATPDMMREVGKLGKVLGPRGLMPTPKAGTVTNDVAKAITELKGGKIEFKMDKNAGVHVAIGKLSFTDDKLIENLKTYLHAVLRAKPAGAKGQYIRNAYISSTMGPGIRIDVNEVEAA